MVAGETIVPEVASSQRSKHGCLTSDLGQTATWQQVRATSALSPQRWGNRPASLWIAEDFECCASG
jgi:hypothetical protein